MKRKNPLAIPKNFEVKSNRIYIKREKEGTIKVPTKSNEFQKFQSNCQKIGLDLISTHDENNNKKTT